MSVWSIISIGPEASDAALARMVARSGILALSSMFLAIRVDAV